MSFNKGEVKINSKLRQGVLFLAFLGVAEFVLTTVFVITFASNILFPEQTKAVANQVAKVLSYEGRLTDASGNALGGSGTNYCFRFSIYDNPTVGSGTKLWPSGTPVRNTVNVTNGVFSVGIGTSTSVVDAAPDDLSLYNFYTNDSAFLNVEATSSLAGSCSAETSFVTLSPRQPLYAVAYARATRDVYGSIFKTDNVNGEAQVGDGTGTTGNPILLALDWKSNVGATFSYVGQSCSVNGAMWYNSSTGNALICSNNLIHQMGVDSTTTIAAIGTNGTALISAGTVVFSNGNGVTFGQNGSTITASAAGGGGAAGVTRNMWDNMGGRDFITNVTNITAISRQPVFTPFYLDAYIGFDRIALEMSRATSGSNLFTIQMAIYTQVNSTQISMLGSLQNTFSGTNTASISGVRQFFLTGIETAASSLTPGNYVMGVNFSAANSASMNYSIRGGQTIGPPVGIINNGANSNWTATSQLSSQFLRMFQGRYSVTSNAMPATVAASQLQGWTSAVPFYFRIQNT